MNEAFKDETNHTPNPSPILGGILDLSITATMCKYIKGAFLALVGIVLLIDTLQAQQLGSQSALENISEESDSPNERWLRKSIPGQDRLDGASARFGYKISQLASAKDKFWDSRFSLPGLNGWINAVEQVDGVIFAAGNFSTADGVASNNIARWNGYSWEALGLGTDGTIHDLEIIGDDLYVGGEFSEAGGITANKIARYNTTSNQWFRLGNVGNDGIGGAGEYSKVFSLEESSTGDLLVGGYFATAGLVSARAIASWNGGSWSAMGSGLNSAVYDISVSGSLVAVGGRFTEAGGSSANRVAIWNGANWSDLGTGIDGEVYAVSYSGSTLFVGGDFSNAGSSAANNIAQWSGVLWSPLGSGTDKAVFSLNTLQDGTIIVGGNFETADGVNSPNIASYDSGTWQTAGGGVSSNHPGEGVFATAVVPASVSGIERVVAVGRFSQAGSSYASHIAELESGNWSSLSYGARSGVNGPVRAILADGDDIYVGGYFTATGSAEANSVAIWDKTTSTWSEAGSGLLGGAVLALAKDGSDIFAGGNFNKNGNGSDLGGIAKFNGATWTPLESGISGGEFPMVYAVATGSGGDVFVGGNFELADGLVVNGIARWNDSSQEWFNMGSGVSNGSVHAIKVVGSDVYVGGSFQYVDGNFIPHLAKWNSTNGWSAVSGGVDDNVYALDEAGGELFVGGAFTQAGGLNANRIVKFNLSNSTWSALANGLGASAVSAIDASSANSVHVAGSFDTADGSTVSGIAMFNGSWTDLGSGANEPLRALAVDGQDIWVGGYFSTLGGRPSYHFGRYSSNNLIASCSVDDGWNMVSVPMLTSSMAAADWYPDALPAPSTLFRFDPNVGYVESDPLSSGTGYWGLFDQAFNYNVASSGFQSNRTINLFEGWNLIGGFEASVDITDIVSSPIGNIVSDYFGFDDGYKSESNLLPCRGYWVLASSAGNITLPSLDNSAVKFEGRKQSTLASGRMDAEAIIARVRFEDRDGQVGELSLISDLTGRQKFKLPPIPPSGIMDLRFDQDYSSQYLSDLDETFFLRGAKFPVKISALFEKDLELTLVDGYGGDIFSTVLRNGDEQTLEAPIERFHMTSSLVTGIEDELPSETSLGQNYPNPFNPRTEIVYTLKSASPVQLMVFNSLGQLVSNLVDRSLPAGTHKVSFDASGYPSGLYLYQLKTEEKVIEKMMTIIK